MTFGILSLFGVPSYAELIDPTLPTNYAAGGTSIQKTAEVVNFILKAVLISDDSRVAVINDSVVKVGDSIGDEKVKTIDTYKVTLVGASGELELKLFENAIKEPAK